MTHGTSAHGGSLPGHWADAGQSAWRRWAAGVSRRVDRAWAAGETAPLRLLALGAMAGLALGLSLTAVWQAAANAGPEGRALWQLALAAVAGALLALRPRDQVEVPAPRQQAADGPSQLLAQMHHELRTPLTAMIGFSEVMARELHGPLGNARYQEYAVHISESGGRLLKASENALAVAHAMSALVADLVADGRTLRRERLSAASLLREAWAATAGAGHDVRLSVQDCGEIACDRRATVQALQHLLDEALASSRPGSVIAALGSSAAGARHLEVRVGPPAPASERAPAGDQTDPRAAPADGGGGVRVILARSLLEMQDATLRLGGAIHAGPWSAHIAFPAAADERAPRPGRMPNAAGYRRRTSPVRRADCAAAAAACASAESRAAPPA